jgi:hypothetical protein
MAWRVARSLLVLRDQINAAWPDRDRASDGTIGDEAHQASYSDHNPDAGEVVRALDVTHDPAHGCDIGQLSDALADSRDERISYIIANRLITGPEYSWLWEQYDGDDPHTNHLHLSVVADDRADDARPWSIGASTPGEDDDMRSLMRYRDTPQVFLTDGLFARWVTSEAEIGDLRTLSSEGTIRLGYDGKVRVVTRRELVGRIIGRVPAGWEDLAVESGDHLAMTDAQVAAIAAEAATVLGTRVEDLEEQIARITAAVVAAGKAAGAAA